MHVVATAGHVDHGKSTLVRALTGMEPDRWSEERRRGMTIDLGFAWTTLPSGETVAFVDVPGHARFVANMLAGVGPVPAVLFVVAADEGWMPQSAEHLAALDALGVRHGVLVVTRSDLADPMAARDRALQEIRRTSLGEVTSVCVSAATGEGLDALRDALDRLVASLPEPDHDAPVRLWVDRAFTVRGAGTVVTGTLPAGVIHVGDELVVAPGGRRVKVRALESLKAQVDTVPAVARVAVNLRGVHLAEVRRGCALLTPDAWLTTRVVDVRADDELPREVLVHVGSAAIAARVRTFGADTARLTLTAPLPLRIGERLLLRDPGSRRIVGATALDVSPPALVGRGAGALRAQELAQMTGIPDPAGELRRRRLVGADELRLMGCPEPSNAIRIADRWLADPTYWANLRGALATAVAEYAAQRPLTPGLPLETARQQLRLPDRRLVEALVSAPLTVRDGRIVHGEAAPQLPPEVARAVEKLRRDLAAAPFSAPTAARLAELGLTPQHLAAAVRAGHLVRVADGVYLMHEAIEEAVRILAKLPQPFTVSQARQALGTSRRVAVPLLEFLDRRKLTQRIDDVHRKLTS
ncbi:selenocysteine-specific translation elongation factor [Carbonactinospora thermoautotrophica]|uniref:selenocysteine-specific translation elongation factor n=1 Tax=Carbonactinospora thermoautotrophica TaxID=1469144 RepID=UPI00226EDC65|nr:selenocysteine-specific translation elongation factor [Carbonactinospora thermoautotrophica]MCX9192313.1 selenocysteine-specific translation elongation factor [Carbonactinospora thermoautotrophica]